MKNLTFLPCDILKPFVKSFVISEAEQEGRYKVLPDTGLVIGFQYKGRLHKIENGKSASLAISGITGLADHSRTFRKLRQHRHSSGFLQGSRRLSILSAALERTVQRKCVP